MSTEYQQRLQEAISERGLTRQHQLAADQIGIPKRTLQDILAGRLKTRPQRATREKIDAWLDLNREGAAEAEWPPDLRAFLDILGAYLYYLSDVDRTAFIDQTIAHLARRDYADETGRP